ncbi:MAG: HAD family hydrolase [bacterium]
MFIIDFDDTLFDTRKFKSDRMKALEKIGISEKLYEETYLKARNELGLVFYNSDRHARVIAQHGFDEQKIKLVFYLFNQPDQLKKYLFSDAKLFLRKLKKLGEPLALLSLGNPEFQYLKVKGSGIHEYFDRVFMTSSPKKEVIKKIIESHDKKTKIWLINDKISETIEIIELYSYINAVLKKSKRFSNDEYKKSNLIFFSTLNEIYDYITGVK